MNHSSEQVDLSHSTLTLPLLEAKNISHNFDYPLFDNIDLDLHKGKSIAIIGMSGSGKSTLLNILSSLLKPKNGTITYNNEDIYSLKDHKLLKIRRKDFGIIFQAHYLFRGFSADENLQIASLLSDKSIDYDLLKSLNIDHVMKQGVGELSGGQQQRLSIARILTKNPKIIFADEPTGNLDKNTANEVMNTLFDYIKQNGAALILVTHEEEIAFNCDKVYKLVDQKLQELK
ncbi:MAG: ABC transporter ATP-binding protein [Campylobacteraceae bacterium]|nr:ABC transporter ATP-binding protein [Campylobacteraceae bacterium]